MDSSLVVTENTMKTKAEVIDLLQCIPGGHIWFSGKEGEGEYKHWYDNGRLWQHSFWKNGELNGEYKEWYDNGQLAAHGFWKKGIKIEIPKNIPKNVKKGFI